MAETLIQATDRGLYCARGGFYIDPWRAVKEAVVRVEAGGEVWVVSGDDKSVDPGVDPTCAPFELAFEEINESTRHKSGIALPRMTRWRTDQQAPDADTIETVRALLRAARDKASA